MLVLLSNYSKMMRVCRKSSKMILNNVLLQNSQIQHRSGFGDPLGLKIFANVLLVNGRINAEKYVETLQDSFFQETEAMFGKKESHSSSNMSMQPLTNQYLPKFT